MKLFFMKQKFTLSTGCILLCMCYSINGIAQKNQSNSILESIFVDLAFNKIALNDALLWLNSESGIGIVFNNDDVVGFSDITLNKTNISLKGALSELLKGTNLSFKYYKGNVVIYHVDNHQKKNESYQKGRIAGVILDEADSPLPGATIWIEELGTGVTTDFNGNFILNNLAPGSYSVSVSYVSYQKQVYKNVDVGNGGTSYLNVKLEPSSTDIEAVTITAEYDRESVEALYAIQKESYVLGNGISAEQISYLPDNNVGQVLKRVTGLTVQNNKFVVVRGMSERYNNVMLNGALMPSTEPNRKNFSFDIIPAELLDNVVVAKTFSPDLPAEFSGGIVQISTIDIPKKSFLSLTAGTGLNTRSTGEDYRGSKRYSSDYFGGGGERTWMNTDFDVDGFYSVYALGNIKQDETYNAMSEYMVKIPNSWGLYSYTAHPQQNYCLSFGKPLTLNNHSLGVVAALTYRHEEKIEDFNAMYRDQKEFTTDNGKFFTFTTSVGGVANLAWKYKNQKITWNNLYNRKFSNSTNEQDLTTDATYMYYEYYNTVLINTLWQSRVEGKNSLWGDHVKFNWFADRNQLIREQPDDRFSRAQYFTDSTSATGRGIFSYEFSTPYASYGGFIMANLYEETKSNAGANLEFSTKYNGRIQKIKLGCLYTLRDATSEQLSLRILNRSGSSYKNKVYGQPDYMAYDTEYFTNYLYYRTAYTSGNGSDKYTGNQDIRAFFFMAEISPFKWFRLTGGVRFEESQSEVTSLTRTADVFKPWEDSTAFYSEIDWLPSLTAILNVTDQISVKSSYSQTVSRPDFRERSTYSYYDVNDKAQIFGNEGLVCSYSENYDARIEWYPAPGEVFSVGVFYKYFTNPAEMVTIAKPSGGYMFFYFNLDEASTRGLELELRKSLSFMAPGSGFFPNVYLTGNAIVMNGDVTYNADQLLFQSGVTDAGDVSDTIVDEMRNRTLQGLAPFVINAGISYQGKHLGFNCSYNRSGDILMIAGSTIEEDEYEQGRDIIDLQLSYKFFQDRLKLKCNVSDILAQPYVRFRNTNPENKTAEYTQDPEGMKYNPDWDWTLKKSWKGTNYSLSLSLKF